MANDQDVTMEDLLSDESDTVFNVRKGDVLEGTVVSVDESEAIIDLGLKSEGILPSSEVDDISALEPGSEVLVYVITPEDRFGQLLLSAERANRIHSWMMLRKSLGEEKVIQATIAGFNKGGCVVDVFGLQGFLPFSLFVSGPESNLSPPEYQSALDKMRGEKIDVVVIELDSEQQRIIVSEKGAIDVMQKSKEEEVLQELEKGEQLTVTVKHLLPYGLLVSYHGIDALIPKDELSWEEDESLLSSFEIGQAVDAVVVDIPKEMSGRPTLSIKQLVEDPWEKLADGFKKGGKIKGSVKKITSFGLLVEVEKGIEGLIPMSEVSKTEHEIGVGDELDLEVKEVDTEKRRLELGMG